MSEVFLDYPPVMMSFSERVRKRVFWPCWSYLVPLKGGYLDTFNLLDTLALRLVEAGITDVRELSSRTGLKPDLMVFILDRLFHRGYLNERLDVTDQARVHLDKAVTIQDRTSYYYVYRDAVTGVLLNAIISHGAEKRLRCNYIEETKNGYAYLPVASAGKERGEETIRALRYPQGQEERHLPVPTPKEVSGLFRYRQGKARTRFRPALYEIDTAGIKVEKAYIAVDIILQTGASRNWIVSDGFGSGFSPVFENAIGYLEKDDLNWLANLKTKSADHVIDEKEGGTRGSSKPSYPSSSLAKRAAALSRCESEMAKYPERTNDTDRTALKQEDSSIVLRTLYEAMEWTFSILASRSRYSDSSITEMYQLGNDRAIARTATRIARSIGFALPTGDQFPLFRVRPGAVTGSYRGSPSLWPLIVLSLFNARSSLEHPLRTFARTYPGAVEDLASLKRLRDGASHARPVPLHRTELESWMRLVRDCGELLIPDGMEENVAACTAEMTYKREQRRIKAEAAAEENLGYSVLRALPSYIADLAVEVETHYVESTVTGAVVIPLDKLLGSVFLELLERCASEDSTKNNEKELGKRALERAHRAGIRVDFGMVESILKATDERVRTALNGNGSSMQASCAAWLLCLPNDELFEWAKASSESKDILEAAGRIAKLRGHGYVLAEGTYTETELKHLKEVLFRFIRNLVKVNWLYR